MIDFIGYAAAVCTTVAFAPQLIKAWRTRSTTDISVGMFLLLVVGIALWVAYGALRHDIPVMVANGSTLFLASAILFLKLMYK